MTSRQLRKLRKSALTEAREVQSSSDSAEQSDSDSDGPKEVRKHVNPFELNDASEDEDEDAQSSLEVSEPEAPILLKSISSSHTKAKGKVDQEAVKLVADLEDMDHQEVAEESEDERFNGELESVKVESCFEFQLAGFNPELEMTRISQSQKKTLPRKYKSLTSQRHGYLCPNNELLKMREEAANGRRWDRFDPRTEDYFTMSLSERDSGRWALVPTERYSSTFDTLEDIIARGDIHMLHEFTNHDLNPFHPSANIFLANSYIQQDQYETAFKYILRSLGALQATLAYQFHPSKLTKHTHTPEGSCRPPMPHMILSPIDEWEVAQALATIADDLHVDWDLRQESTRAVAAANRERREEIKLALHTPAFGNLLLIRTLHMYAWSLVQRGCPQTSLSIFRLIVLMTLSNDVAHALLFAADVAVRARETSMLRTMVDRFVPETWGYQERSIASALLPDRNIRLDCGSHPFAWRLDYVFPQYAFSTVLAALRELPPRTVNEATFTRALQDISAAEFWEFVRRSLENSFTTLDPYSYCYYSGAPIVEPFRQELQDATIDGQLSAEYAHLALLRALWLFPALPDILLEHIETDSKSAFQKELRQMDAFNSASSGNVEEYLKVVIPTLSTTEAHTLSEVLRVRRLELLSSYCKQSKELWAPLIQWVRQACAVLNKHTILEAALGDLEVKHHNFRLAERDITLTIPRVHARTAAQVALFLALPTLSAQYAGVRVSEFDPRQPVLSSVLLNSCPEASGTGSAIARRNSENGNNPWNRWLRDIADRTGRINLNSNPAAVFLRALLPWSTINPTGANF